MQKKFGDDRTSPGRRRDRRMGTLAVVYCIDQQDSVACQHGCSTEVTVEHGTHYEDGQEWPSYRSQVPDVSRYFSSDLARVPVAHNPMMKTPNAVTGRRANA